MTILKSHILHPYEDRSLTFKDLKEIISLIGNGTKIDCFEKFDGINILISWDLHADELRIARNKSHLKQKGLGKILIDSEFSDRPELLSCLQEAYDVLSKAFQKLDFETKSGIFGSMGGIWYSAEIINPNFFNTLKYENKMIVFHNNANMIFDMNGDVIQENLQIQFANLLSKMNMLNDNIESTEWSILPSTKMQVRPLDELDIKNHLDSIDSLISNYQIPANDSIQNYLYKRLCLEMERYPLIHRQIRALIIKNVLGMKSTFPLDHIKNGLDRVVIDQINQMVPDIKSTIEKIIEPIERIMHEFSSKVLKDLKSSYVGDSQTEINRIKAEVGRCINVLQSTGDAKSLSILQKSLRKLQSVDRINSAIEGIVFRYKNKLYKITGFYAPINQICGHVKYNIEKKPVEKQYISNPDDVKKMFQVG